MKKLLGFAEQAFTVLSLLHYSGGPLVLILAGGESEGEELVEAFDPVPIRVLFLLIYVVTFLLLVLRWKKVLYLLRKDKFIWVLVAIAVLSIKWSFDPSITLMRCVGLVGTSSFGLYLATRYTLKQQIELLGWTCGTALIMSLIFVIALPKYGIMGGVHTGAWRGIYPHKNSCGIIMMLSAIIFLLQALGAKEKHLLLWSGFGLSFLFLILSRSTSSLLNFFNLIAIFLVFRALRLRVEMMVPALCLLVTVFATSFILFQTSSDAVMGSLDKSSNLSGRTDLWIAVLDMIGKRPWLGYGYGAFWLGWESEAANVWYTIGWKAPYAHNGWLDVGLSLGLVGLLMCASGFAFSLLRALLWVRFKNTPEGFWPGIYIIYLLLANMTETTLMVQNNLSWVLYIAVSLSVLMPPERTIRKST